MNFRGLLKVQILGLIISFLVSLKPAHSMEFTALGASIGTPMLMGNENPQTLNSSMALRLDGWLDLDAQSKLLSYHFAFFYEPYTIPNLTVISPSTGDTLHFLGLLAGIQLKDSELNSTIRPFVNASVGMAMDFLSFSFSGAAGVVNSGAAPLFELAWGLDVPVSSKLGFTIQMPFRAVFISPVLLTTHLLAGLRLKL